jgi:hypothetical protein
VSDAARAADDELYARATDSRLLGRLLGYLRPYRLRVAFAVLLLLVAAALELVGPLITRHVLDRAIPEGDVGLLGLLVGAYLTALLLGFAAEYAQMLLTTWLGQRVMYDLRTEIFAHLQRLSLRYFDRNPVGRLMTRVTNDVETLNEMFSSGVVSVFGDVFTLVLHHGGAPPAGRGAGAGHLLGAAAGVRRRVRLPRPHPPRLPRDPGAAGADQRLPAGARGRDARGAALRARGTHPRASRRSTATTWTRTCAPSPTTRSSFP